MSEVSPSKVATFCELIFSKYIGFQVHIKPETDNKYESRYSLNDPKSFDNLSIAISDRGERELKVFPFLSLNQSTDGLFWIYFSITYNVEVSSKKAKYLFDGVSIAIFRGLKTDVNKEMLFRAEWDCKSDKPNKKYNHPHPHWHIHFVKEKLPQKVADNFEAFLDLIDAETTGLFIDESKPKEIKEFNISKFHFAMGASWDSEKKDNLQLNEISLKSWLNYTLKHIKEQLEYAAT